MSIEDLAEDFVKEESEEEKEKIEPKVSVSVESDIFDEIQWVYGEIRRLEGNVADSKRAKLENLVEFREELSAAKRELFKEWGKLLNLGVEKRSPTVAEAAWLKEGHLVALNKAVEAAKSAGVENLENIEVALRETKLVIERSEPHGVGETPSDTQTRETAPREKQRLFQEARF